jgi:hypothetical protein
LDVLAFRSSTGQSSQFKYATALSSDNETATPPYMGLSEAAYCFRVAYKCRD